jgi:hypothetical protein
MHQKMKKSKILYVYCYSHLVRIVDYCLANRSRRLQGLRQSIKCVYARYRSKCNEEIILLTSRSLAFVQYTGLQWVRIRLSCTRNCTYSLLVERGRISEFAEQWTIKFG